jgi:hypothetical protein
MFNNPNDAGRPAKSHHVVLLGDSETVETIEALQDLADRHDATISAVFSFESGEAARQADLTEVEEIPRALGCAITGRLPVWVPYVRKDLVREQHFRRISLVLQRHGLNLLAGPELAGVPTEGGMTEVDYALRWEVQAVDQLDRASLAATGAEMLDREIAQALVAAAELEGGMPPPVVSPPPRLPAANEPWDQRQPVLKRYAMWLTHSCGLTQTSTAQCLNATGHRTANGHLWRQPAVSALVKGRYDGFSVADVDTLEESL